jgi:hypothetical protein
MAQITATVTEVREDQTTKTVRLTVQDGSTPLVEVLLFNPVDFKDFNAGDSVSVSWAPVVAP